jgi:3-mercaptopyruvate sulfurtransferase SseA
MGEDNMRTTRFSGFLFAIAAALLPAHPAAAIEGERGHLVTAQWLQNNLGKSELLLDASFPPQHAAKHIPDAVNVNLLTSGFLRTTVAEMEQRLQSLGLRAGRKIVIYDQGGDMMAPRLFFDLYYHGVPAQDLFILDGGLAKWQEIGGATTKEPMPAPAPGNFRITQTREEVRVRLPEFLVASGDPANHALVEALEPSYHFGEAKFFDRAGHVPNAVMMPRQDFYNPDKTFKSPDEVRRMVSYYGIRPEQTVHAHCGGGVAAAVPFFALKFILNYPKVKLYVESQLEWLQDKRGLPFWTYGAPYLKRDKTWLHAWSNQVMRPYGVTQQSVIDVRPADAYKLGHVPFALNVPAAVFRAHADNPEKLAELLSAAGVNQAHEAVIVSDGGLNPHAALAFVALERIGQKRVSILMDSVDEWGLSGLPLSKEPTAVGPHKSPVDLSIPPTVYRVNLRPHTVTADPASTRGQYPKVFIASGPQMPSKTPAGTVLHVPCTSLLNPDGTPKAAKDIWNILAKAGVPRYAEIVVFADDAGEAAANYFVLKLMGFPDVKVLMP